MAPTPTPGWCIQSFAGNSLTPGYADGTGTVAQFGQITGLDVYPVNNGVFVTDYGNNAIRRIPQVGGSVSTYIGRGVSAGGSYYPLVKDGGGTSAILNGPYGIAIERFAGSFVAYFVEADSSLLRSFPFVLPFNVTTLAGGQMGAVSGNGQVRKRAPASKGSPASG